MTSSISECLNHLKSAFESEGETAVIHRIDEMISRNCNNPELIHAITDFTLSTLKNHEITINLCWRLAEIRRDFWLPYVRAAECYIALMLHPDAIAACVEGIANNCESIELSDKLFESVILTQGREKVRSAKAACLIEDAIKRFPGCMEFTIAKYLIDALTLLNNEQHEECTRLCDHAIKNMPQCVDVLEKVKEFSRASQQCKKRLHVVILTCLKTARLSTFRNIYESFLPFLYGNNQIQVQLHVLVDTHAVIRDEWELAKQHIQEIDSIYSGFSYHFGSSKDGFDALRNHCFQWTSFGDWILMIDDDELLFESFANTVASSLCTEFHPNDLVWLPRLNTLVDDPADLDTLPLYNFPSPGTLFYPDYQARLFRNLSYIRYSGKVHERIVNSLFAGHPTATNLHIIHHKTRKMQAMSDSLWSNLDFCDELSGQAASGSLELMDTDIEAKIRAIRKVVLSKSLDFCDNEPSSLF